MTLRTTEKADHQFPINPTYLALALLICILYFYLRLFANALTDDAFITLRYVKTLLETGTWGFLPGYVINAVTSPLNIFFLAFAGLFLGATINAVLWLAALLLALTSFLLVRISCELFKTESFGYLAAGALILNPLIVSTLGLESILFISLYVLAIYLYLTSRWSWLAVVLGLITLTRFDGVLVFVAALVLIPTMKLRARVAAIYALCIAPWYIFSWIYFGSLLPDTLFIKMAQRSWGEREFFNGLGLYYDMFRSEVIFSFLYLPFVFSLFNKTVRGAPLIQFLLLTTLAHFAGYSFLHVPPYYWYYVPETTAVILIGSLGLGILSQQAGFGSWDKREVQSLVTILLFVQAAGMFYVLNTGGLPVKEMPIHSNWATHEQYKAIGEWLKDNTQGGTILVDGEIGTLGYYCDCSLSSFFSDRKWLRSYALKQTTGSGMKPALYRINFLFLDKTASSPAPVYLLREIPNAESSSTTNLMQWQTSTKWLSKTLIELSRYSR